MAEEHGVETPGGHGAIHLPPPSYWPAVLALGIAVLLTGLIINLAIAIVGALITLLSTALWIRDARRELRELPE
jgi:hypothetical protein